MTVTESNAPQSLPTELYQDLATLDRRSHEFKEGFLAANELAMEAGYRLLTMDDIFPPVEFEAPAGFSANMLVPGGMTIRREELDRSIHSLAGTDEQLSLTAQRLVTDTDKPIIVGDLRGLMTKQVQKLGPQGAAETAKLDKAFMTDVKRCAEQAGGLHSVRGIDGVYYTKPLGSLLRAYWVDLGAAPGDTTRRLVRVADARSKPQEEDVYNKVLKAKLKN